MKTAALALALTGLLPLHAAHATAYASTQVIWAETIEGLYAPDGTQLPLTDIAGIGFGASAGPLGDGLYAYAALVGGGMIDHGRFQQTVSQRGGVRFTVTDPAAAGGGLLIRVDASGGDDLVLTVNDPRTESASVIGTVYATSQDSIVHCAAGNTPLPFPYVSSCTCWTTECQLGDFSETREMLLLPPVGKSIELDYYEQIDTRLMVDEPTTLVMLLTGLAGLTMLRLLHRPA